MTNIQTYIALPDEVRMTLSHFSVKACGPSSLKNGDMHFQNGQLSRNLTDILQMLEAFQRIISRLGTNWTGHIEENLFKPKIHLSISATFYLAGSALCNVFFFQSLLNAY